MRNIYKIKLNVFLFYFRSASHSLVQFQGRSFGTPLPGSNALQSPPEISPVHTGGTPMRRVKSATRLDFTRDQEEMSLDASVQNTPATPRQPPITASVGSCSPLGNFLIILSVLSIFYCSCSRL